MPIAFESNERAIAVAAELAKINGWRYRVRKNERGFWQIERAGRGRRG